MRRGDNVVMLSGKDRGKQGKIVRVTPFSMKVVVDGLNFLTKHTKPRRQGEKGQKIQVPRAVPIGTVMLVCPKCSRPTRVRWNIEGKTKERVCKKCGRAIS